MDILLEVNNIRKKIKGKEILRGINFTLEKGKVLGVMGPNGQGKTTLLNTIQGFLKDFLPKLRIFIISTSDLAVKSPKVLIPALFKQL